MTTFAYSPQVGAQVLATWGAAQAPAVLPGADAQQGLVGALANAEAMAAARGFATPITVGNQTGVIIGGARANAITAAKLGNEAALVYLAQTGNVRAAMAQTVPVPNGTPVTQLTPVALPIVPILIALTVVGVAASVAAIEWAHADRTRTELGAAKQVASTDAIVKLASTGQPIDPQVLAALRDVATAETNTASSPISWPVALTAIAVVGGLFILTRRPA